ncbi:cobalamin B12-binding domain-containing protein [Streptomyces sp. NBC_00056]|uniref:MerR family transcriptional regulator n=1 Tax=unclassified Streptomyces TaxID=2593676 RepID=UPI00224F3E24|nr:MULTISPECIES: MerR family transcriptional regulator [unclassified Streptomyces]MCX5442677.1 cobalamin B12-binding domain-containing protein [Streptomyces sp. NBC_00063]WUB91133.1 cobalamin B12-binding domain-containing protein [Streptomyces sp. NBC_00569]
MASDGSSPKPSLRGSEPPGASITSGALARRLGISPTTLRSWDQRYSLGPARRRRGHHRRWSPQDVAMVEDMCSLTASGVSPAEAARSAKERRAHSAPQGQGGTRPVPAGSATAAGTSGKAGSRGSSGLPFGAVRAECRGLARAALRLESVAIQEQLNAFVQEHGVVAAWEELMMPTLHAVGRKWESSGDRYVEVEHLLSWHVSTALRNAQLLLGPGETRKGSSPVLLACVPGEQHTLPLEAVHAALLQRGRPVRMLGAAVPAEALIAAVLRTGPAAVVLWSQTRSLASAPLAVHLLGMGWGVNGARQQAALVLAGPGWRGARIEGAVQPQGLREAIALLAPESSVSSE